MKSISIIEAKFLRSKTRTTLTKLWKNVSNDFKLELLQKTSLNPIEKPIIIFFKDFSCWWLLTNERLIVYQNADEQIINLSEIEKVELKKLFEGEVTKEDCSSIQLFIKHNYIDLVVEKSAWPIIYEILRFMIFK